MSDMAQCELASMLGKMFLGIDKMLEENHPPQRHRRDTLGNFVAAFPTLLPKDAYSLAAAAIMASAFIYACGRAWLLSMTHDEALTLYWHVPGSVSQIFLFETPGLPDNNHLLHTLLVKLTTSLFGGSEFSARMPSLLGYALYLRACYLLLGLVANNIQILFGAVLLAFHPYLVDFFSIARGYSLGVGFMMMGVYFFIRWANGPASSTDAKTAILASLMFALAVTANLSFMLPYAASLITWFLVKLRLLGRHRADASPAAISLPGLAKDFLVFVPASALLLLSTCLIPIKKLSEQKLFALGGTTWFWVDTAGSLIDRTIYEKSYAIPGYGYGYWFIYFVITLAALLAFHAMLRRKQQDVPAPCHMQIILIFIVICSGISIIQHYILGAAYLVERRAIFLIPLFLLLCISLLGQLKTIKTLHLLALPVYIVIAMLDVHFILCANLEYYFNWRFDASTKQAMALLKTQSSNLRGTDRKIRLGINWLFEPAANYYINYYGMDWVSRVSRDGSDGSYDYYYEVYDTYNQGDVQANTGIIEKYGLQVLAKYPISGTYFAVPKDPG